MNNWTLIFSTDDRQIEVFRAKGDSAQAAAKSVRRDNPYLNDHHRCIAAMPGYATVLTTPSHAGVGEDVFE